MPERSNEFDISGAPIRHSPSCSYPFLSSSPLAGSTVPGCSFFLGGSCALVILIPGIDCLELFGLLVHRAAAVSRALCLPFVAAAGSWSLPFSFLDIAVRRRAQCAVPAPGDALAAYLDPYPQR